MIPAIAYIVPLYTTLVNVPLLNVSLLNNYWGLWLPYSINAFGILIMKTFFESIRMNSTTPPKSMAHPCPHLLSITLRFRARS